jgi:hypothetical protein
MLGIVALPGLSFSIPTQNLVKTHLNKARVDYVETQFSGNINQINSNSEGIILLNPADTLNPKIKSGFSKLGLSGPKKPTIILNLNLNEGAPSPPGVSDNLRIIPNAGIQFNMGNLGIGFDAGMFKSGTDFNYDTYYSQIDSLGFIYENTPDKWKTSFFTIGPQYTLHFSPAPKATGARSYRANPGSPGTEKGGMDLTFSLKFGVSKNRPPDISIFDSAAPHTLIASYQAPEDYKENAFSIKPGIAFTYWFNDRFGANANMQYMVVTGQDEFETGYRDLSKVNWSLDKREIRYQVMKAPLAATTTTSGPGNMFTLGAGVNVKFGLKEKSRQPEQVSPSSYTQPDNTKPEVPTSNAVAQPAIPEKPLNPAENTGTREPEKEKDKEYIRPSILYPSDGSTVSAAEFEKSIQLKWTAVTPPPPGPVVYHIKIYEIIDGQQPEQAIRVNKAVFDKNITSNTQLSFSKARSDNPKTSQSKYTWTVQATDQAGKPYGANNGTSTQASFMIGDNDIDIAIDSLQVECCKDGKQLIKFTIKNNLPNSNTVLKKMIITAVNGNFGPPQPIDITAMVSPALPYSFLPSSTSPSQGRLNFTASIDCNLSMNNLVIKAEAERNTNMGMVTDNDLESDSLNCICHECDKVKITLPEKAETSYSANSISISSPVSVGPKKVKKVTANIVYFSYKPESDDCAPCNKDSKAYGNFTTASLNASGFPVNGAIPYGHEAVWNSNSNSGAMLNGQFNFNISVPPLVKCCSAKFRFCIRYIFQFEDCTVCEKVVCYTINKEGCNK